MCVDCRNQVSNGMVKKTGFKLSKEERSALPGKQHSGKKVSELTPEELEERRIFRRAYERKYREWRKENGDSLREYQREYHKVYNENHKEELRDYVRDYVKLNPDWWGRGERKRRALKALVETQPYGVSDVLKTWGTNCYLCDEPIDLEAPRGPGIPGWERGLHLDHVMPISAGGPDTLDNVKPAHGKCNLRKHASTEFASNPPEEELKVLFKELFGETKKGRPLKD